MKKKSLLLACLTVFSLLFTLVSCKGKNNGAEKTEEEVSLPVAKNEFVREAPRRFWIWINPKDSVSDNELKARYKKYYDAGVKGIFFEADNEQHFRIAKSQGLETHRWMWIMNRGEEYVRENHPEWYAVNRKGESCFDHPPYVDYYRWLCPSRPEVVEYLKSKVDSVLTKRYVDGIHLDYIRYSDGVLAVNLWKTYDIVQTEELPEYDYCYCDVCKAKFKEQYKQDIDSIEYPQESLSWRKFRYDAVTNVVNELTAVAKKHRKDITAAVFPTPDVAKKLVKQDWTNWNLTAIYPMIYHGFYKEPTSWIGSAVKEGGKSLNGRFPLYAGLYLPDFKDMDDFRNGIKYALDNGAAGVSIFGKVDDDIISVVKEFRR